MNLGREKKLSGCLTANIFSCSTEVLQRRWQTGNKLCLMISCEGLLILFSKVKLLRGWRTALQTLGFGLYSLPCPKLASPFVMLWSKLQFENLRSFSVWIALRTSTPLQSQGASLSLVLEGRKQTRRSRVLNVPSEAGTFSGWGIHTIIWCIMSN